MTFKIIRVDSFHVGGLVVPTNEPGPFSADEDLMHFTLERLRVRGIQNPIVVFVRNPEVGWSAVAGYRCRSLDDLEVGDSLITTTTKYVAQFTPDEPSADPCEDLWRQADVAEKQGDIVRAYTEEMVTISKSAGMELFISLK